LTSRCSQAQEAYEILSNPEKRQEYDEWGHDDERRAQQRQQQQHHHPFDAFFGRQHHEEEEAPPIWSEVLSITDHNFNHYIEGGGIWLFEFYSDSCEPCQHFAPTWDRLATNLEGMIRMGRVDAEGGFHGPRRTISIRSQFQRLVRGYPGVVAYDGKGFHSYHGSLDYEGLLQFAADRIPDHITPLPSSHHHINAFLQARNDGDTPRILLFSAHSRPPILFRHVAFELNQFIEFGFVQWTANGDFEHQFNIDKAPALVIQKEKASRPLIIHDVPKDRKTLLRLLMGHRFDWVQKITAENFGQVCGQQRGNGGGTAGAWCVILLHNGATASTDHPGMASLQKIAKDVNLNDPLPAPTAFAWLDTDAQSAFLEGVMGRREASQRRCQVRSANWAVPSCYLAINVKIRRVGSVATGSWAPWPPDLAVSETSLLQWLKELATDIRSERYLLRRQPTEGSWPWPVVADSSGPSTYLFTPSALLILLVGAFVVLGPPANKKAPRRG